MYTSVQSASQLAAAIADAPDGGVHPVPGGAVLRRTFPNDAAFHQPVPDAFAQSRCWCQPDRFLKWTCPQPSRSRYLRPIISSLIMISSHQDIAVKQYSCVICVCDRSITIYTNQVLIDGTQVSDERFPEARATMVFSNRHFSMS